MKPHRPLSHGELLDELEPTVEKSLNRHLDTTSEWFPHDYVPYEEGRNFVKEPWQPSDSHLPDVAQVALEMNLLTEDNLPYYHLSIWDTFGREHPAWADWVRRWTAEEGRHAIVLRDYLTVTRGVDPVALERERMAMVQRGYHPDFVDQGPMDGVAFASMQELATRISHRNTGMITDDETAVALTARIATDENLHYVFYRDMVTAALQVDPSPMVEAIHRQITGFEMPGAELPAFKAKAKAMAKAGVYNLGIHHDQVLVPVVHSHWKLAELDGLTDDAKRARDDILAFMQRLKRIAIRIDEPDAPVVPGVLEA